MSLPPTFVRDQFASKLTDRQLETEIMMVTSLTKPMCELMEAISENILFGITTNNPRTHGHPPAGEIEDLGEQYKQLKTKLEPLSARLRILHDEKCGRKCGWFKEVKA